MAVVVLVSSQEIGPSQGSFADAPPVESSQPPIESHRVAEYKAFRNHTIKQQPPVKSAAGPEPWGEHAEANLAQQRNISEFKFTLKAIWGNIREWRYKRHEKRQITDTLVIGTLLMADKAFRQIAGRPAEDVTMQFGVSDQDNTMHFADQPDPTEEFRKPEIAPTDETLVIEWPFNAEDAHDQRPSLADVIELDVYRQRRRAEKRAMIGTAAAGTVILLALLNGVDPGNEQHPGGIPEAAAGVVSPEAPAYTAPEDTAVPEEDSTKAPTTTTAAPLATATSIATTTITTLPVVPPTEAPRTTVSAPTTVTTRNETVVTTTTLPTTVTTRPRPTTTVNTAPPTTIEKPTTTTPPETDNQHDSGVLVH